MSIICTKMGELAEHTHIECDVNIAAGNCDYISTNKEQQRLPTNQQNLRQRQGTDLSLASLKRINYAGTLSFDF